MRIARFSDSEEGGSLPTETPDRDPMDRDPHLGQRPPSWIETPLLDRDPLLERNPLPGQRPPPGRDLLLEETPWTETPSR